MKKWSILLTLALTIGFCLFQADLTYAKSKHGHHHDDHGYQQPGYGHPTGRPGYYDREQERLRKDAHFVIERTTMVIKDAQQSARHHRYHFGLAKAIAHQERARDLYWQGEYREAIYHSLRARDIAFQIIRGNREHYRPGYYWNDLESGYRHDSPRDQDLDVKIQWRHHNDKEMILLQLFFDLD